MKTSKLLLLLALVPAACDPGVLDREVPEPAMDSVSLPDVARLLSALPIGGEQLSEVHAAVSASSRNGYDEEYTMRDLFESPGAGVGDRAGKGSGAAAQYDAPLRSLIETYVRERYRTKAGETDPEAVQAYLDALAASDAQIYWPYSEEYDGKSLPVITFDPGGDATANVGYRTRVDGSGKRTVEEIVVDEDYARTHPVWVVNNNSDSGYASLEMRRRADPDWGRGGEVLVKGGSGDDAENSKMLVLKYFKMNRNYDSWFGGASEFFVKCGSMSGFKAKTESEMQEYYPTITDFMIVVKRRDLGSHRPFNAILISDWTDQIEDFCLLVTEDDGGTRTSWKCSASAKVQSKSYGFDLDIPYHDRDDIVWRGTLSRKFFEKYSGVTGHFGDVELTFGII
ncbi:MAG: hypothetical protein K6F42_03265 [Bacteroidales bacterium]|nr:hypothetical protein [Bacteroidales bacterium]